MTSFMNQKQIIEAAQWRYAVKKYDAQKKISEQDWFALTESLRLSPSSYGLQPWKFFDVKTPAIREQLFNASFKQTQVIEASHYVVIAYKYKMDEAHIQKFVESTANIRGQAVESLAGFKKMMMGDLVEGGRAPGIDAWAQRQCYIAMGQMMMSAAAMGIDTTPMEGFDPKAYDKILDLENTGFKTVVAVAAGYRHSEDKYQHAKKSRFAASEVLFTK
jgi:nitroreductase